MSGPEEVIREALKRAQEIELSEFTTTHNPAEVIVRKWTPALSALDVLVERRDGYEDMLAELAGLAVTHDPGPGWRVFREWSARHDAVLADLKGNL